jgi:hypothetical protein
MSRIGDFADDDVSGWIALSPELGKAMAAFSSAVYNRNRLPMRVREIALNTNCPSAQGRHR